MKNLIDLSINLISSKKKLSDNRKDVTNFLVEHPKFALQLISAYYPFTGFQLIKYGKFLNWKSSDLLVIGGDRDEAPTYHPEIKGISNNENICWSFEHLNEFKDQVNWKHISRSTRINWWSTKLIKEFADDWDWMELSSNNNLRISSDVINEFKHDWIWDSKEIYGEGGYSGLSKNASLEWNQYKIEKFSNQLNWDDLSLNSNLKWHTYGSEWKQEELGYDKSILKIFEDSWNYNNLSENISLGKLFKVIPESQVEKILEEKDWNWKSLSGNDSLSWTEEFVKTFKHRISWKEFCKNEGFNWTDEFITKNISNINWASLSLNRAVPWSIEIIDKYKELWDWDNLSLNSGLPWSKKFLKRYKNKWNWDHLSSYAYWDKELLASFKKKVKWNKIILNDKVYIDFETMFKYHLNYRYKLDVYTLLEFIVKPKPEWDVGTLYFYLHRSPHHLNGGYNERESWKWNELINNHHLYSGFFSKYINESTLYEIFRRLFEDRNIPLGDTRLY